MNWVVGRRPTRKESLASVGERSSTGESDISICSTRLEQGCHVSKATRAVSFLRVVRLGALMLSIASHSGFAQSAPSRDSMKTDTMRVAPRCIECGGYAMLFSVGAFFVAPAAILVLFPATNPQQSTPAQPSENFSELLVEGRLIGDTAQSGGHSESVEWSRGGTYLQLRLATWYIPQVFQYQTVRVGKFFRTAPLLSGGVTHGYQRVPHDYSQEGPEIALPVVIGNERLRVRSDASYVFSHSRVNISYRCDAEARVHGPVALGLDFELKSIRNPTPFTGGVSLVMTIRQ